LNRLHFVNVVVASAVKGVVLVTVTTPQRLTVSLWPIVLLRMINVLSPIHAERPVVRQ